MNKAVKAFIGTGLILLGVFLLPAMGLGLAFIFAGKELSYD
jgi:hypothetical protein